MRVSWICLSSPPRSAAKFSNRFWKLPANLTTVSAFAKGARLRRSLPDGRSEFTVEGSDVLTRPAIFYMDGLGCPLLTERFERSTVFLCDLSGGQFMPQWVGTIHNPDVARRYSSH